MLQGHVRRPGNARDAPGYASNEHSVRHLPPLERVLRRWESLRGVLGRPADRKLPSAVRLARCCADPPLPSVLPWGNADCSSHGEVGGSSSFANVARGGDEFSCLTISGGGLAEVC